MGNFFVHYVGTVRSFQSAENKIYHTLTKDTDGFLATHINRKVSLFITKYLSDTNLSPNQITLGTLSIGLLSAFFFAMGGYGPSILGALIFQFSSITDGCDGEIARLKFMESRFGGWLDIFCDNLTHIAVFGAIAYGAYKMEPATYLIIGGFFAVLGTLMSFLIVAFQLYKKESTKGPLFTTVLENKATAKKHVEKISAAQDSLARRDFTYILIVFALLGYTKYFLILTAVGSNIFWILLLYSQLTTQRKT